MCTADPGRTIIVPWVLRFAYGSEDLIPFMMLTVGIGECWQSVCWEAFFWRR